MKLKLVRIVNENTALFAKALVPSAMSFAPCLTFPMVHLTMLSVGL